MAAYSFIDNINDFFSTGYFTEDFQKKVFDKSGYSQDGIKELCSRFSALRQQYNRYKQAVTSRYAREKDKERETFNFNSKLLVCLGYYKTTVKEQPATVLSLPVGENGALQEIPVRIVCSRTDGSPQLYVMDIPTLVSTSDESNAETGFAELGFDRLVTHIFSLPEQEHPRYILMSSGNMVFFMDADKWERGAYLRFDIERLLVETTQSAMRNYFALFYLLVSRETLAAVGDTPLMQQLEEESYKNAYAVTQDLKRGVVAAVEALANEAIWYIKHTPANKFHYQDETDDNFETMMRDDCLVFIYRLLFVFYAESRPDLDIFPINDQTYQRGYSLEMLRDLEQVNLITDEERNGYFFDHSIKRLFALILKGYNEDRVDETSMTSSFRVRHIDSPLFSDQKLKVLAGVKFRNVVWQSIICQLSLSQQQKGKMRGRISYANLGINQLGSVYENLLAYRGFYAEEDYIEVHPKGDMVETYLQPRSRRDVFEEEEILKDEEGHDVIHPKGKFIYRLNGRDRKKSASFYTPEVLTKSTVKYTMKPIVEKLERGEIHACDLLQMKLLEPAMGAAAFQNEVINQLAVLYLQFRKHEVGESIDPLQYPNELQKVKAFIATNNVYGVDLNATAIELGKLSLWLNVIHKDMEVPFFSNRLAVGNAVIGAWLKVYKKSDVVRTTVGQRAYDKKWWEAPARRITFSDSHLNRHYTEVYHFLLPVQDMLGILNVKLPTFSEEEGQKLKENKKVMAAIRKSWLKGITSDEYKQLERISRKIDVLLKEYVEFQMGVAEYANNGYEVWKYAGKRTLPFNTNAQREDFDDQRYRKDSSYMRLKMVMDYWCALFFWEYKDLADLPTRQDYWDDIERILNVDMKETSANVRFSNADKTGLEDLFMPKQGQINFDTEEAVSAAKVQSLEYYLTKIGNKQTNKLQLEGAYSERRFDIVEELAKRYHFFHPMLEFLEVFWQKNGFDIICGNPPFLKWNFEAQQVLSDNYPELVIRPDVYDADYVEKNLKDYLTTDKTIATFNSEMIENECCKSMLNSAVLYGQLKGCQTDLFKCILLNSTLLQSPDGFMGMIHPDTVYTENKGQILREHLYPRLVARYHYSNRMNLFNGVHGEKIFDSCIYRGQNSVISFDSISNVCMPSTIDACYSHRGDGICLGLEYVDENGKKHINTAGHKDRIIHYDEGLLRIIAKVFENTDDWQSCKLVSIHTMTTLNIIRRFMDISHVTEKNPFITVGFDATNDLKSGMMRLETKYPNYDNDEMIFNSTQVGLLSPFSKMPQVVCAKDSQYDGVDYELLDIDDDIRTNYVPDSDLVTFQAKIDSTDIWFQRYKIGFKKMMDATHERTLKGGILPPKASHTNSIISASFDNENDMIQFAGLSASVMFDFFIKTVGVRNLTNSVMSGLPFCKDEKLASAIAVRVLRLNCVNHWYKNLWESMYQDDFSHDSWSSQDTRLSSYGGLTNKYDEHVLLRNDYERCLALIELDVLAAMTLGFSLKDLETVYIGTFSTTQKYEADTWYDVNGHVVYSVSSEYDLKLPRKFDRKLGLPGWEDIRGELNDDGMTYFGVEPLVNMTVSEKKSQIYAGKEIVFKAPYTRCDRIADYRRAWAFFEERFKNKE